MSYCRIVSQKSTKVARWLKSFKTFSDTAQVPQQYRINIMLTFLDGGAQIRVKTLNLDDEKKKRVEECYELITRAIEGITLKNECRASRDRMTV